MKYHLIGDSGVSMSAIKEILKAEGNEVSGSDLKTTGHSEKNITDNIDEVIYTSAITPGSAGWCEIEEAKRRGIKLLKRSQFLAEHFKDKYTIAVSGMHGKTTVTSLIGLVLIEAGLDPTVLIGEKISEFGDRAYKMGKSKYFVVEACEYDRSFLDFCPDIAVITNIDFEHLDTYPGGISEIKIAFSQFIAKIKAGGTVIANKKDHTLYEVVSSSTNNIEKIYYGEHNITPKDPLNMALFGRHNKSNAMAVHAIAKYLKINDECVVRILEKFKGAKRRLEYKGSYQNIPIYDDYGHHPTEISATVSALKEKYPDNKIVCVFWPHQYKRILPLRDNFKNALSMADEVIVKPIFLVPGRDEKLDISSDWIVSELNKIGTKSQVIKNDEEIVKYLKKISSNNMVILTMGIPPIYRVAEDLIEAKK